MEATNNEKILLEIAKEILSLNPHLCPSLTGSLMLCVRGISKRREAHDIDILINQPIDPYWFDNKFLILPEASIQASPTYPDSIKFEIDGVLVDFLYSEEGSEVVDGINCSTVESMVSRKMYYAANNSEETAEKHKLDIEFLGYTLSKKDHLISDISDDLPW